MKGGSNAEWVQDSSDGLRGAFDVWYGGRGGDSGDCEGEFGLCEVWEWRWVKVAGYPFSARALETVCSSCVLVTADDVRACAREYKVCTTAILWARG